MQAFKASGSKERILKKIRKALEIKVAQPFINIDNQSSVYKNFHEGLEMHFAKAFTELGGNFIYCDDEKEFAENFKRLVEERGWKKLVCWENNLQQLFTKNQLPEFSNSKDKNEIESFDASITGCEFLIARTGTITHSSKKESGRSLPIYLPVHIIVAYNNQLVADMKDALLQLKAKYKTNIPSMINFETGPSRTADIEKTLVVGVHGPKEIFVFFIDEHQD
jgi:L-lactate dehydrogenase complex protein LldG